MPPPHPPQTRRCADRYDVADQEDHRAPHQTDQADERPEDVEGTPIVDPTPGPTGRGGEFAVLTMQELEPYTMAETFHSPMPTPEEIEQLQLPAGEPIMVLQLRTFTRDGHIVEFARGIHAASSSPTTASETPAESLTCSSETPNGS
jgi:UTRA domain